MSTLLLDQTDVARLLPMRECIDVMQRTFEALGRGDVVQPLRSIVWVPGRAGGIGMMPGSIAAIAVAGAKVVSVFPANAASPYESHQGCVLLFEHEHGRLVAVVDAGAITTIRTAAVSALATRALSNTGAGDMALLGAGTQAESHLEALCAVRQVRRVRIWNRSRQRAASFAARACKTHTLPIELADSAEAAVRDADLVCTVTGAHQPILLGAWLAPGAHVNAIGACIPAARELDTAAVRRSKLFVDWRQSAAHEAGDFLIPKSEGAIDDAHIQADLAEVVLGTHPGRTSEQEITVFKSLGLAVEDIAAAHYVYTKALACGVGRAVTLGGMRHAPD